MLGGNHKRIHSSCLGIINETSHSDSRSNSVEVSHIICVDSDSSSCHGESGNNISCSNNWISCLTIRACLGTTDEPGGPRRCVGHIVIVEIVCGVSNGCVNCDRVLGAVLLDVHTEVDLGIGVGVVIIVECSSDTDRVSSDVSGVVCLDSDLVRRSGKVGNRDGDSCNRALS